MYKEIVFAKGDDIETQQLELSYKNLDVEFHPDARFPKIRKFESNDTITKLGLTPRQGRWLAKMLTKLFEEEDGLSVNRSGTSDTSRFVAD